MSAAEQINSVIAKGYNVAGAVNAVRDVLPTPVRDGIEFLFNTRSGVASANSLKGVQRFRSLADSKGGFLRTNHYYVTITNPLMMRAIPSISQTVIDIPYLAVGAALPGLSFATTEIRRYGYGTIERKPYAPIFVDQNITFLGDGKGDIHRYFISWMNGIVKFDEPVAGTLGYNGLRPFEVEYKQNYKSDITITTIDETNKKIIEIKLYDAYPIFIGDISLSWDDTDQIMRIPVTFTYTQWKRTDLVVDLNLSLNSRSGLSMLQRIVKAGTAIQTLATVARRPRGIADTVNIINTTKKAVNTIRGAF